MDTIDETTGSERAETTGQGVASSAIMEGEDRGWQQVSGRRGESAQGGSEGPSPAKPSGTRARPNADVMHTEEGHGNSAPPGLTAPTPSTREQTTSLAKAALKGVQPRRLSLSGAAVGDAHDSERPSQGHGNIALSQVQDISTGTWLQYAAPTFTGERPREGRRQRAIAPGPTGGAAKRAVAGSKQQQAHANSGKQLQGSTPLDENRPTGQVRGCRMPPCEPPRDSSRRRQRLFRALADHRGMASAGTTSD